MRIGGKIYYAGAHVTINPSTSGEIEMCINDENFEDNDGAYNVRLMIFSSHSKPINELADGNGGSLFLVTTTDGKRYLGSYFQKGQLTEIVTPDGKVSIISKNISMIAPYKKL